MAVRLASFFLVSPLRIRFTISDRDYFIRLRVSVQVRCPPFLLGMEWLGTGIIPRLRYQVKERIQESVPKKRRGLRRDDTIGIIRTGTNTQLSHFCRK
jgi:hypothetical protein